MKLRQWLFPMAVVLVFAAVSCGDDDGPTAPNPNPNPNPTPNPTFASGNLNTSAPTNVFVFTFADNGTFDYRCTLHQPDMDGTVVVSAAGVDSPQVTITNNVFTPQSVNVKTGSYVKWVNTQGTHNVTRP